MDRMRVTDQELKNKLDANGITVLEACKLIYHDTGVVICAKHVATALSRSKELSAPYSAAFRYLFNSLKNGGVRVGL